MITLKWDANFHNIVESQKVFGRYTKQTAIEKINAQFPDYKFKEQHHHGFGGYWVNANGDTIELVPAI